MPQRSHTHDSKFSDYLHVPELGAQLNDQEVLQYTMGREHTTIQHYSELAETAPDGPVRELFRYDVTFPTNNWWS